MPFSHLKLNDNLLKAIDELGYQTPTPIQEKAIPLVLSGQDVIAAAQTGTGKTAAFVLPILQRLDNGHAKRAKHVRALILTPTRELAEQVHSNIEQYAKYTDISSLAVYGGIATEPQKQALIEGVDILVATPGRLLDLAYQRSVHFSALDVLVLDEADRMLDMGFSEDINKVLDRLPTLRQTLLFSATLSSNIHALAELAVHNAVEISVTQDTASAPKIKQYLIPVDKDMKSALLSHLITENQWRQALIFIQTKHGAAKLVTQLEKRGIAAESFHSGRSQAMRTELLEKFKKGEVAFLIATGIAARGIDIDNLDRVVNYDLPDEPEDYIHRIGRTGRAGATGEAVSLVSKDDFRRLCDIETKLNCLLDREIIEAFTPRKELPVSILNYVPKRANKMRADSRRKNKQAERGGSSSQRKPRSSDNPWGK
ncbi:MAG: DEAD/DEAH box helicase [Sinobacterium sp.]|nr:DEAD/DEAH box helicase [Sinobacterium sp.]